VKTDDFPQPGDPVAGAPPALTTDRPAPPPEPDPVEPPARRWLALAAIATLAGVLAGRALLRRTTNQSEESP
jgi:hypothetical protein